VAALLQGACRWRTETGVWPDDTIDLIRQQREHLPPAELRQIIIDNFATNHSRDLLELFESQTNPFSRCDLPEPRPRRDACSPIVREIIGVRSFGQTAQIKIGLNRGPPWDLRARRSSEPNDQSCRLVRSRLPDAARRCTEFEPLTTQRMPHNEQPT